MIGIALGNLLSGAFTKSDQLWSELERAGLESHERFWRMPIMQEYSKRIYIKEVIDMITGKNLNSQIADIKNVGGRSGGAILGAVFLSEFINMERWAHLDIAAAALPSNRESSYVPNGMTGMPARAIIQFVRNHVVKNK